MYRKSMFEWFVKPAFVKYKIYIVLFYLFYVNKHLPCDHPSVLVSVGHSADRNASEFSDCAHVLSWGVKGESKHVHKMGWRQLRQSKPLHGLSPVLSGRSPVHVLTSSPSPGPDELPRTAWPSRDASFGIAMGWKSAFKGLLLHVRLFLKISYMVPWWMEVMGWGWLLLILINFTFSFFASLQHLPLSCYMPI